MPTGYTSDIYDEGKEVTLRDYALRCARGMGFAVMMRDDSLNKPLPEKFEPYTDYHDKTEESARERRLWLESLTPAQIERECDKQFKTERLQRKEANEEREALKKRYVLMELQVYAWEVPDELLGLKKFMLDQLATAKEGDTGYTLKMPEWIKPQEWLERELAACDREIEYAQKHRAEEIERTNERNHYLELLRSCLPE